MTNISRLRAIMTGSAGHLVEWYDWYAYAACAIYFAPLFFPSGDQTSQLLQAAAVFAVGFFARPVGAWITGLISDHMGRKAALVISVGMMCFGSLVIALTPGYAEIGVAAPIILVLARIFQGLSLGGEYGASATYMSEVAGAKHRGFWSSFSYVMLIAGQLLALAVLIVLQRILPADAMAAWGWRIPFAIGALLAVAVFWMRRKLPETESYIAAQASGAEKASTWLLLRSYPRETLTILMLTSGGSLIFYVYTTYMQKFLVNSAGFSKSDATELSAITLVIFMLLQPLCGWLSDIVGRKTMLIIAFAGGATVTYPIMTALGTTHDPLIAGMLIVAALIFQSAYTSISAVVKAELFPTNVRTLGVALPYALANAIFGGTAEYVALWFKKAGAESGFFIYAAGMMAIALPVVFMMRDTRRHSRILED